MDILIILHHSSTMNTQTNDMCVFFLVQGSPLDSNKKSSRITLSNNGRTASSQFPRGSVVGTVGYSSGVYQWRIKITELGRGYIGIGVTTLPLDDNNNYNFRSDGTMYAWFSNQYNTGLAASQTVGPARISRWQTGDIVLLTLNCDQLQLHLHLQRTAERKTINMKTAVRGEKLYLYMYLYTNSKSEKLQVDIVSWKNLFFTIFTSPLCAMHSPEYNS